MSELTLTLMRLGLLVLLWFFVFSITAVLRTDIYGTQVARRRSKTPKRRTSAPAVPPPAGQEQPRPKSGGRKDRPRKSRGPHRLTVTAGPLAGTSLPLRPAGTLIGRSPECALVLDDDYASGRHARVYHDGTTWLVEDLGSTNGTYLGQERLTAPRPVGLGATLRIGKTVVELTR